MRLTAFLPILLASSVAANQSVSDEATSIFGITTVAPGQLKRFTQIMDETLPWIQRSEPGTLQLEVYTLAERDNGTDVAFFEKYANLAARTAHSNSQHYNEFIAALTPTLVGEPILLLGNFS